MGPVALLRGGAALLPLLALVAGCGGSSAAKLMDGGDAEPPPGVLARELPDATATRLVVRRFAPGTQNEVGRCVESFRPAQPEAGTPLVERVGVSGRSLTFRIGSRRFGCDAIADPRFDADLVHLRPWCGFAVGKTRGGTLDDPRLGLCAGESGKTTAFAWIEPVADARWIDVRDGSRHELYPVAASLPVRVSTTSDVFSDRADFHVAQYGADGRLLAGATVEAVVAG